MSLPQKVVAARKKKGLTQEELANITNITVRTIQRIESGETTPRSFTLKAIAAALDTSFEELQVTETNTQESPDPVISYKALNSQEDAVNFLQLLCLSCFSYLVLPFIHFIIPLYLLRKRKEHDPAVIVYGRKVIRTQIYWVIALNPLFLLTVAFNVFSKTYLGSSYIINYLVPFFVMYLANAFLIVLAFIRVRRLSFV